MGDFRIVDGGFKGLMQAKPPKCAELIKMEVWIDSTLRLLLRRLLSALNLCSWPLRLQHIDALGLLKRSVDIGACSGAEVDMLQ